MEQRQVEDEIVAEQQQEEDDDIGKESVEPSPRDEGGVRKEVSKNTLEVEWNDEARNTIQTLTGSTDQDAIREGSENQSDLDMEEESKMDIGYLSISNVPDGSLSAIIPTDPEPIDFDIDQYETEFLDSVQQVDVASDTSLVPGISSELKYNFATTSSLCSFGALGDVTIPSVPHPTPDPPPVHSSREDT